MLSAKPGKKNDPRHLRADLVPLIIEATQDYRPIHWLVAKFIPDDGFRQRAAVTQLESILPQITQALATLQRPQK